MARRGRDPKLTVSKSRVQKRMIVAFAFVVLLFALLTFRVGWIQIVAADFYASKAAENQMKDQKVPARRGDIFDRNMKELAVSSENYTIYIRLKPPKGMAIDPKDLIEQQKESAELLSSVLGIDEQEILDKTKSDSSRAKIASKVSGDQMDLITKGMSEKKLNIIEAEKKSARLYPLGSFASQLIGTVNSDGAGQSGVELQYEEYLSGIAGRKIMNTDRKGNPLVGGEKAGFDKRDGYGVVLTIDETIQYYLEDILKRKYKEFKPVSMKGIVMDPKTGEVLAMSSYPNYDLNNASVPNNKKDRAAFDEMSADQQSEYLSEMWRNKVVSDLYEPGSVFKLVTASSALETGSATPTTGVNCKGVIKVEDREIHCHIYPAAHGYQTLTEAVGNSCNPGMVQIVQRMGYSKFYKYLELFGMTKKTGIDLPAEADPLTQDEDKAGPVGLATMSFGMGLTITPVEMAAAVSSIVNDGKYMQPHVVKAFTDADGNTVKEVEPKIVRQVISSATSNEMKKIMQFVTDKAGGQVVHIPGYKIGSKSGTAQKLINGHYIKGRVVCSMLTAAPLDDPKFVTLIIVDDPEGGGFGGTTAGPAARELTEELLRYYKIKPVYENGEKPLKKDEEVSLPKLSGKQASEAEGILLGLGLKYKVVGEPDETVSENEDSAEAEVNDFKIVDQYPKKGQTVKAGSIVYLYAK